MEIQAIWKVQRPTNNTQELFVDYLNYFLTSGSGWDFHSETFSLIFVLIRSSLKNSNNTHTCKGRTGSPSIFIFPMMDENKLFIDASNSKRPFPGAALKHWILTHINVSSLIQKTLQMLKEKVLIRY